MKNKMTDQELLEQAHDLRTEASRLLYDEGLFSLISSVGPACIIGSFALDLMTWPDLDVSVQLRHEKDISTFFDLGRDIANRFQATKMSFSNQSIRPDVPFDHGLYWGIRLLYGGRTWKIDLWGYGDDAYQANLKDFDRLRSRLHDVDRVAILRIKNEVCQRPEYRVQISSMQIYEAVGQCNIRTVEEFDEWRLGQTTQAKTTDPS